METRRSSRLRQDSKQDPQIKGQGKSTKVKQVAENKSKIRDRSPIERKPKPKLTESKGAKSIFQFTVNDIDGNEVSLEKYRGLVTIIVNVASRCGYTKSNYSGLNDLYDKYEKDGLRILAFPCNQFGGQEPKSEADIKEFMNKRDVRFDAFSKIAVNGKNSHPLYEFLKSKLSAPGVEAIKWNFTKFLVDKEGIPVQRFASKFDANKLEEEIKKIL